MTTVRKIRFTPKPTTLREKELVLQYTKLLRERDIKYKMLQYYNERLYAQYTGLNEVIHDSIGKSAEGTADRVRALKVMDDAFIQPFHPLKDK
jgi:hypothetical protein